LMVLTLLKQRFPLHEDALQLGLSSTSLPGRFQIIPGEVSRIFDVGHNPQAAAVLAGALAEQPSPGRTLAVVGMLADKDHEGVFALLCPYMDEWYTADLDVPRGARGKQLSRVIEKTCGDNTVRCFSSVTAACQQAMRDARPGDRVVVFGSFFTVLEVLPEAV